MKALLSHAPGGPETLRIDELPDPVAGSGELLIRVRAAAINFPDVLIIEDKYQMRPPRPFAPGGEIAGEVEAVGEGVTGWHACLHASQFECDRHKEDYYPQRKYHAGLICRDTMDFYNVR